jgi:hypothetical protein
MLSLTYLNEFRHSAPQYRNHWSLGRHALSGRSGIGGLSCLYSCLVVRDRTRRAAVLAVLSALAALPLAGACGGGAAKPAPEIRVGSVPPPVAKIAVVPPDANGLAPFPSWPKACDLLTDADVRGLLPQSFRIQHRSADLTFNLQHSALDPGRQQAVAGASCGISWWLPGDSSDPTVNSPTVQLHVSLAAVGTPALVRTNYFRDTGSVNYHAVPLDFGADECAEEFGETYECRRQQVAFSIGWELHTQGMDRFQGQGRDTTKQFFDQHVGVELVRAVIAKLP